MILERFPEIQQLSPSEKLAFVSELWNDLEVFYEAQPKRLIVAAIMDLRQDPRSILQKLGLPR